MGCDPFDPTSLFSSSGGGTPNPTATQNPTNYATQSAFGPSAGGSAQSGGSLGAYGQVSPNQADPNSGMNSTISSLCGSQNEVVPYTENYSDPLGPNISGAEAPSGGPEMRAGIYSTIQSLFPSLMGNTNASVNALQGAAANPGYADAAKLAINELNGQYLNGSPELDTAVADMRNSEMAGAENTDAALRSKFAANGMSLSTPEMQAEQANDAAANASAANTEAQMRLSNYQTERTNQNNAVQTLDDATGSPVNYLSQVNAAEMSPLSSIGQLVAGLSGGSQISYQPQDVINNQGYLRQLTSTIGSL